MQLKTSRNQQNELTIYNYSAATPHYAIPLLMATEKVNYYNKAKIWAILEIVAQPKIGKKYKECVRDCINFLYKN